MNEVKIQVFQPELIQRQLEGRQSGFIAVADAAQLAGDKQLFALSAGELRCGY